MGQKFITFGEIMLRLTPPNYGKIRVANSFYAQMLSDADSMQSITDALLLCEAARPGCEVKIEVKAEENSGGSLMDEIEEF